MGDDVRTIALPGTIDGRPAFFAACRDLFPLDPPVVGDHSLDALADSLWEAVHNLSSNHAAVVIRWPVTGVMRRCDPAGFAIAADILLSLRETLPRLLVVIED